MISSSTITPCLWFDEQAEQAAIFYTGIFKNSFIGSISRYGKEGFEIHGKKAGTALTVSFTLNGLSFTALNGGPQFKFTEAVSFVVACKNQDEIDYFWNKLTENGEEGPCGWLKDKFGLSWQVVPEDLGRMMSDKDPAKPQRVMKAFMQMKKLDVSILQKAFNGEDSFSE